MDIVCGDRNSGHGDLVAMAVVCVIVEVLICGAFGYAVWKYPFCHPRNPFHFYTIETRGTGLSDTFYAKISVTDTA